MSSKGPETKGKSQKAQEASVPTAFPSSVPSSSPVAIAGGIPSSSGMVIPGYTPSQPMLIMSRRQQPDRPMASSAPARVPDTKADSQTDTQADTQADIDSSDIFGTKPPTEKRRVNPFGW